MDKDRQIFDICLELKKNNFYQVRGPNSFYYITPTILMRMDELSDLRNPTTKFSDFEFPQLILQPTIEELLLQIEVTQIQKLVSGGFMAYQDNIEGMSYRAQGETIWMAIANLFITKKVADKKLIPDIDTDTLDESNSIKLDDTKNH